MAALVFGADAPSPQLDALRGHSYFGGMGSFSRVLASAFVLLLVSSFGAPAWAGVADAAFDGDTVSEPELPAPPAGEESDPEDDDVATDGVTLTRPAPGNALVVGNASSGRADTDVRGRDTRDAIFRPPIQH